MIKDYKVIFLDIKAMEQNLKVWGSIPTAAKCRCVKQQLNFRPYLSTCSSDGYLVEWEKIKTEL